jgi:hypothetical protein
MQFSSGPAGQVWSMLSGRFSEIFDNVNEQLSGELLKPFVQPDPEFIQPSCVRNPTEKWGVQAQDPHERTLPLAVHIKQAVELCM